MSSRVTETKLCKYRMGRSCCKWCQFPCKPHLKSGHGKGFSFAKCTLKEIFGGKPYQRQESLEGRSIYEQECIPVDGYRSLQWPSLPWGGGRCLPGSVGCVPLGPGEGAARQTPVKTLPCPKLPLWEVIN